MAADHDEIISRASENFILLYGSDTLRDLLTHPREREATDSWIVVIRSESGFRTATIGEFRSYAQAFGAPLSTKFDEMSDPLATAATVDQNESIAVGRAKAKASPAGTAVVLWGSATIGVFVPEDEEATSDKPPAKSRFEPPPEPATVGDKKPEPEPPPRLMAEPASVTEAEGKPESAPDAAAEPLPASKPEAAQEPLEEAEPDAEEEPVPEPRTQSISVGVSGDMAGSMQVAGGNIINRVQQFFQGEADLTSGPEWLRNSILWVRKNAVFAALGFVVFVLFPVGWLVGTEVVPALQGPPPLVGDWNIAVTPFLASGENKVRRSEIERLSNVFFSHIEAEITNLQEATGADAGTNAVTFDLRGPGDLRPVRGSTPAEREADAARLADQINANVVIYGQIVWTGGSYRLQPEFYVRLENDFEAEELTGQHTFGRGIEISGSPDRISADPGQNRDLGNKVEVLALVTRGLSLYFDNSFEAAYQVFQKANTPDYWITSEGREVLYLFEGNAALRSQLIDEARSAYERSIELEPGYSRGYSGLASVLYLEALRSDYDPALLAQSEDMFQQALSADIQPESADIETKVDFGLGQVYFVQWYYNGETSKRDEAVGAFNRVIDRYNDGAQPRIQVFAAESYARLGLLERIESRPDSAVTYYEKAVQLHSIPARRGTFYSTLANLYTQLDRPDDAADANQKAIDNFSDALLSTRQPLLQAQYRASMASAYENLGDSGGAREQWEISAQRAVEILAQTDSDQQAAGLAANAYAAMATLDVAEAHPQDAIENYQQALQYATTDARRGEYQARLALLYHDLGDDGAASVAGRASLDLLPEGDPLRAEVEALLSEIDA